MTALLDIEITSLDELRRHLATLSDAALERLRQALTPEPKPDDMLAAVQHELARRRAEQEAGPLLLAKLDNIAARLRQSGIPRLKYVPQEGHSSPDAGLPGPDRQRSKRTSKADSG
jgi:hypothetical protein